MRVYFTQKGDFSKTKSFLQQIKEKRYLNILDKYGQQGVDALSSATPERTGLTSRSWSYSITVTETTATIFWNNSNVNNGVNIAALIQYGHGTKNGGYVQGIDYINPALAPLFENLAKDAWEEVIRKP